MDYVDWSTFGLDPTTVDTSGSNATYDPTAPQFDYGMNDRGLGTTDPSQAATGVLSPGQIAGLGSGTQIGANGLPVPNTLGLGQQPAQNQRGLFTNPDGSPNWASILGILGPLAGGAYAANRTGAANQQIQQAIQQANSQITGILGGNAGLFQPYRDAGMVGLNRLTSMPASNLAGKFPALGTPGPQGPGYSLGAIAKGK